jgi:hypothetical protein
MKKCALLLLLLLPAWAGFPQEAGSERIVPFVSKLKVKADESQILVTWHNPKNLQGSLLVYRHTAEIDQDNLADAVLIARLNLDRESYEDSPQDFKPYYYAVLIEDQSGTVQKLFIPFRNKTSKEIRISALPPVESTAPRITDIRAVVSGDSVQVSFETSNTERQLLLFRSNSPMTTTEDLLEAFAPLQLEAGVTRFIDFPIPGVESYYAVIDSQMFKLGKQVLVAGENATIQGVVVPLEVSRIALPPLAHEEEGHEAEASGEVAAEAKRIPTGRPVAPTTTPAAASSIQPGPQPGALALAATPLPYLQPVEESGSGFYMPQQRADLNPQTQAAVSRLLSTTPPVRASQRRVVILPEDKDEPIAGESTGLYNILQDYLVAGDYAGAESKLQGFLNLRRSPYTEARVRFYLAQAYYFQGLYEEALLEFVLAQGELYAPVQPWLESCFRNLWEQR